MDINNIPQIKFDQYWQGVEWAARQHFEESDLSKQFSLMEIPDENICNALSVLHENFYTSEAKKNTEHALKYLHELKSSNSEINYQSVYNNYVPWVLHRGLFKAVADKIISKETYDSILKEILKKEWLLTWHWRAVLPSLRQWKPRNSADTLIIQISHIRKWEMLLCYSVTKDVLDKTSSLSEIPLKEKKLLRAPLFGISNRLRRWDTYRLFYQHKVKEYVKHKVQELEHNSSSSELAYVLGRHDCYYIVEHVEPLKNTSVGYTWTLRSWMETEPEKGTIDEKILGKTHYYKPPDLIDIPAFGEHAGVSQLLSSDHYCEAIYELTEVLNDPTAKSVLLIAPPGSGKEKLAESTFYCRDEVSKGSGKFIATTLAGLNAIESAKLLFSHNHPSIDEHTGELMDIKIDESAGLFFKALGGALFIDEIDKTDKSIRNMLLRLLESGEVTVPDTSIVIKIPKSKIPLYIFAGSMDRKSMFEQGPADFWTRISHIIEVAHPLGIDDIDKSKKVVKDYLWMFWCIHVKEFMEKKGLKVTTHQDLEKPLFDFLIELYRFLIHKDTVNFATEVLSEEISGRGKPLVSIRTLRSVVARSIFKFVDVLLYSKFDDDPIEIYKEEKRGSFDNKNPEDWFLALTRIISADGKRKFTKGDIDHIEFRVLDSFRSAIRLGTALAQ